MFDAKYGKKSCGTGHSHLFTTILKTADRDAALKYVEEEKAKSKLLLETLEKMAAAAPAATAAVPMSVIERAQRGDTKSLAAIRRAGPAVIPVILKFSDREGVLPSKQLQAVLADIEAKGDARIASGGAGLDADALAAFVTREENYTEILKRAIIDLEGTRRPLPHWLPFVYAYVIGFIPFLIGIIASVIYYGKLKAGPMAVITFCYLFYFFLHGFFQFFAPWM